MVEGDYFYLESCATGMSTPTSSADGSDRQIAFRRLLFQQRKWGSILPQEGVEKRSPPLAMPTDAFNSGWDATRGSRSTSGRWSTGEFRLDIINLVLLAVLKTVHLFRRHLKWRQLLSPPGQRQSNVLPKQRGKTTLNILPEFCQNHHMTLILAYFLVVENLGVMSLKGTRIEGMVLEPQCGGEYLEKMGKPQVDLFASHIPIYVYVEGRDRNSGSKALYQDWSFRKMYAFLCLNISQIEEMQRSHLCLDEVSMVFGTSQAIDGSSPSSSRSSRHSHRSDFDLTDLTCCLLWASSGWQYG